jgi:hypothetical protein
VNAVSGTSVWKYVTTPWLTATNHHFRLVWVNWLEGRNTAFGLKEVGLFAVDGRDRNSNGRQDWVDEILAQGRDTDEDGLTDVAEIDTHGTDPLNPDTDGDHLLDGEEVNLFDTNPRRADSDGDGVSDAEVLVEHYGTGTLSRVDAEQWYWAWWELDSSLVAKAPGGKLTYALPVKTAGLYRVGLQLRNWASEITDNWKFQVEVSVDDKLLKTLEIFADHDFSNTGYVNTDRLNAGDHTVKLKWVNSAWEHDPTLRSPNIRIEKVSFYAIHGPDKNGNGVQDWVEKVQAETAAAIGKRKQIEREAEASKPHIPP